jgi:serine/threonine protein kinase
MEFSLTEIKENGVLKVKDYEETLNTVKEFVKTIYIPEMVDNDETKKTLKATRASLNKLIKSISDRRISIVEEMTREFQEQCKNITSVLDECQKTIGIKVREYEDKKKLSTPQATFQKLSIDVKITSQEMLKKVTDFLSKHNYEYEIKQS